MITDEQKLEIQKAFVDIMRACTDGDSSDGQFAERLSNMIRRHAGYDAIRPKRAAEIIELYRDIQTAHYIQFG